MRRMLRWTLIAASLGCSHPQPPSVETRHSLTYNRLEEKYPVDTKPVLLKKCTVNGNDFTQPTTAIKVSPGRTVVVTGTFAAGEWGISGVSPMWKARDGEPQDHKTNLNDPKLFLVYMVHSDRKATDPDAILAELVENRQREDETEFRFQFDAPKSRGNYVLDIRLTGEQRRATSTSQALGPTVLPIWRCELVVQ